MKDFVPLLGKRSTRDAIDDVFSRDVLGSILLGLAVGKTVEHIVKFVVGAEGFGLFARYFVAYGVASGGFLVIFVYWEQIETAAKEKLEDVADDADDSDSASTTDSGSGK